MVAISQPVGWWRDRWENWEHQLANKSMDNWHSLELELQRQAASSEEIVEVTFVDEFEALLVSRNKDMKLKYLPERNAVRWETEKEYGFERLSENTSQLAASLLKRFTKG
jgi:hypothetical protein